MDQNKLAQNLTEIDGLLRKMFQNEGYYTDLKNELEAIRKENNEATLKLAVLGEFSAGKTTVINALLKEEVLTTADEPTTAINTYLTYGQKKKFFLVEPNRKPVDIKPKNLKAHLTQNSHANARIEYHHPNKILKSGWVIIDTPGSNVENQAHDAMRQKAIEESAAAIYVINAQQPVSKSFIQFLQKHKENLGKFIFVLNKCDQLEDELIDDIDKTIERTKAHVKKSIKEYTGIEVQEVYSISALYAHHVSEDKRAWVKTFNDFQTDLEEVLNTNRQQLLLFRSISLQNRLMAKMGMLATSKEEWYNDRLSEIVGEVETVEGFKERVLIPLKKEISQMFNELEQNTNKMQDKLYHEAEKEIEEIIDSASSVNVLKNSVPSRINNYMNNMTRKITDEVQKEHNKVSDYASQVITQSLKEHVQKLRMAYDFLVKEKTLCWEKDSKAFLIAVVLGAIAGFFAFHESYYMIEFSALIGIGTALCAFALAYKRKEPELFNVITPNTNITFQTKMIIPGSVSNATDPGATGATGAGGGALFGAFVAGPLGAVAGAAIGGFLGSLFGSDLYDLKREYKASVIRELRSSTYGYRGQISSAIKSSRNSMMSEIEKTLETNLSKYDVLLEAIMEHHADAKRKTIHSKEEIENGRILVEKKIESMEKNLDEHAKIAGIARISDLKGKSSGDQAPETSLAPTVVVRKEYNKPVYNASRARQYIGEEKLKKKATTFKKVVFITGILLFVMAFITAGLNSAKEPLRGVADQPVQKDSISEPVKSVTPKAEPVKIETAKNETIEVETTGVIKWNVNYRTDYEVRMGDYVGEILNGKPHGEGTWTNNEGRKYVGEWAEGKRHGRGTLTLADGDEYVGEYFEGKRHGQSTYTWADGRKYVGEWTEGVPNGKGTMYRLNGDVYEGDVKGEANDSGGWSFVYHGYGTYAWDEGSIYVGEWADDKRHGQGTYTWADGRKYVGEWTEGVPNGIGIMYRLNGEVYEGDVRGEAKESGGWSLVFHGQGTYTWDDGRKYIGEFFEGKRHGQGTYTLADGTIESGIWHEGELVVQDELAISIDHEDQTSKNETVKMEWNVNCGTDYDVRMGTYVGEVLDGRPHGEGTWSDNEGRLYVGSWKNGTNHGRGAYTWIDGSIYVGDFENGNFHGQGTLTASDGWKYVGYFANNEFNGQGIYTYTDGRKFVGAWQDGRKHGQGSEYFANGTLDIEGRWINDEYVGN
ncbi:dynamin family protein [Anoxynatronum sibiricum]|uniref:Dynamin family protein n=1 Tax=Anoxynatronum sibiricum TaxID=210623 RepID=A0ABU9VSU6_9CLOT